MKAYKNLEEAKKNEVFCGCDIISLNEEDIANLTKNNVLAIDIGYEYKVFIEWKKDSSSIYPPWLYVGESTRNKIKELEKELAEKEQTIQALDETICKVFSQAMKISPLL